MGGDRLAQCDCPPLARTGRVQLAARQPTLSGPQLANVRVVVDRREELNTGVLRGLRPLLSRYHSDEVACPSALSATKPSFWARVSLFRQSLLGAFRS